MDGQKHGLDVCTSSFDIIDSMSGLSAKEHDICQTGQNFCRALYVYVCMHIAHISFGLMAAQSHIELARSYHAQDSSNDQTIVKNSRFDGCKY